MQSVSRAYKNSIRQIGRNRGYIKVNIGVINSEAQKNIECDKATDVAYFANTTELFHGSSAIDKMYATAENKISRVDGNSYFLPLREEGAFYNNGIVTKNLLGAVKLSFNGHTDLDIKGLTIDFSDSYPTRFTITNGLVTKSYVNNTRYFSTEDAFRSTDYLIITPTEMVNDHTRLRIFAFSCGIVNTFTNNELIDYESTEYISPISESVPSTDVSIEVNNADMYYCPDDPDSTLSFMEIGQEVQVSFGYDTNDDGIIEWLDPVSTYLKTWKADDESATFTATDKFDNMNGMYYGGRYRKDGITLYDLAIEVIEDAQIEDYFIDTYLKEITVYNPLPPVDHASALQIIANAGRCTLFNGRNGRIQLLSNFVPKMIAQSDDETEYSMAINTMTGNATDWYAEASQNYSSVNGSMRFMPSNKDYLNDGYVSDECANSLGKFKNNPKLRIELEATYSPFGFSIDFIGNYPRKFIIRTYADSQIVDTINVTNNDYRYETSEQLDAFDLLEIEFTEANPNSRVFVGSLSLGTTTDYSLQKNTELTDMPISSRQTKVQGMEITQTMYLPDEDGEPTSIVNETIEVDSSDPVKMVYFTSASYDLTVEVETTGVTAVIEESSDFYAKIRFSGFTGTKEIEYTLNGLTYDIREKIYREKYNSNGEIISWNNPLVSTESHATMLCEWLAEYYLGDVEYEIEWRGDPRVDGNDLFYLDSVVGTVLIREYETSLSFGNGGWSGSMKARKVIQDELAES